MKANTHLHSTRLSLILGLLLCVSIAKAQNSDSLFTQSLINHIDSLTIKINKLQNEIDFLYCKFEIKDLQFNLKDFYQSIQITHGSFLNGCDGRFHQERYVAFNDSYSLSIKQLESYKEKYESLVTLLKNKRMSSNLSENQGFLLFLETGEIDFTIGHIEEYLAMFRKNLDAHLREKL